MEISMREKASGCEAALGGLVAAADIPTSPATSLVSTRDLANIYERFLQWAGNLGALQPPESVSSLEYRLRNSPQICDAISGMLRDLCNAARSAKDIIEGVRENRVLEPVFSSDADLAEFDISSSESDSSIPAEPELGRVTEVEQLMSVIKLSLDNLFKASIFIRKFSPKDKRRERARTTDPFDNRADIMYIKDRYPSLVGSGSSENSLAIRLGEANARRRQYFKYCRDHNNRLSTPMPTKQVVHAGAPVDQPPRPRDSGGVPFSSKGSEQTGDTPMTGTEATELKISQMETMDLADPPAKSVVSFATTVIEPKNGELAYPPMPPEANTSSSILCSYCWTVVWLQDGNKDHQWRKHVLGDLAPYVCTFPGCKLELFDSQHIWFEHELQTHRSSWVCPVCTSAFESPPDLRSHIKAEHRDKISDNQITMILKQSIRPVESVDPSQCPFCDKKWASGVTLDESPNQRLAVSLDQFRKHLGHHLEQIALFSLPRLIQTQGSNVNRLSSTPNTDQGVSDHGRGWKVIMRRKATLMAMSYFASLYENLALHVAVTSARVAVSGTPSGLNYLRLSVSLQKRYQHMEEARDLYEALHAGETAASSAESASYTMDNLHNISVLLYQQSEWWGSMADLDESIRVARITATSLGQYDNLPIYKLGLIRSLARRFDFTKSTTDLEEAIQFIHIVIEIRPSDGDEHWATRLRVQDLLLEEVFGQGQWIDELKNRFESLVQDPVSDHVPWQRILLEIGSYLERVEMPELELLLNDATGDMGIDDPTSDMDIDDPTSDVDIDDSTSNMDIDHFNGSMVIDTFPQYRLWKSNLLVYLKSLFPERRGFISVEEHGTEYRLTIPQKLSPAQRKYILRHICYRPESDEDW